MKSYIVDYKEGSKEFKIRKEAIAFINELGYVCKLTKYVDDQFNTYWVV